MILVNTTSRKIWIKQPLLVAIISEVEWHPWKYHANLNREGNDIKIQFQLAVQPKSENDLQNNQVEAEVKSEASGVQESPQPTFGPLPDMSLNYNFEDEE